MEHLHRARAPIRAVVASSDRHLRGLFSWWLSQDRRFEVVAILPDGDAVIEVTFPFDLAVVDLAIHGLGILELTRELKTRAPAPAVVVVTHHDVPYLRNALAAEGASDYLIVSEDPDRLADRLVSATRAESSARSFGTSLADNERMGR